jgi:hypothetical protein
MNQREAFEMLGERYYYTSTTSQKRRRLRYWTVRA